MCGQLSVLNVAVEGSRPDCPLFCTDACLTPEIMSSMCGHKQKNSLPALFKKPWMHLVLPRHPVSFHSCFSSLPASEPPLISASAYTNWAKYTMNANALDVWENDSAPSPLLGCGYSVCAVIYTDVLDARKLKVHSGSTWAPTESRLWRAGEVCFFSSFFFNQVHFTDETLLWLSRLRDNSTTPAAVQRSHKSEVTKGCLNVRLLGCFDSSVTEMMKTAPCV